MTSRFLLNIYRSERSRPAHCRTPWTLDHFHSFPSFLLEELSGGIYFVIDEATSWGDRDTGLLSWFESDFMHLTHYVHISIVWLRKTQILVRMGWVDIPACIRLRQPWSFLWSSMLIFFTRNAMSVRSKGQHPVYKSSAKEGEGRGEKSLSLQRQRDT